MLKILTALLFTCSLLVSETTWAYELPDLGNPRVELATQPEWQNLQQTFDSAIQSSPDRLVDIITETYLDELIQKLVKHSPEPKQKVKVFVINSPSINAFAGPGEAIVLHTGLFDILQDENELAAVLAHELSHQEQHHLWRQVQHAKELRIPTVLGSLLAIALGVVNPILGESAFSAGATALEQSALRFTRAFEKEADRVGITILAQSGFDAKSMAGFFERLNSHEHLTALGSIPEILRTHPVTESRIADARNHAANAPKNHPESSFDFLLIRERLQVLSNHRRQDWSQEYKKTEKLTDPQRYGYAMVLYRTQHVAASLKLLESLHQDHPDNDVITLTLASLYNTAHNDDKADALLGNAYKKHPTSKPLLLYLAQQLIDQAQANKAITLLTSHANNNENDADYHTLLAQAYGKLHKTDLAYFHQARAFQILFYKSQAKEYFNKALSFNKSTSLAENIKHFQRLL